MSSRIILIQLIIGACLAVGCTRKPEAATTSHGKAPALGNGLYCVLGEAPTESGASLAGAPHVVLQYDQKYSDADKNAPSRYIAIDPSSSVPIVVDGKPDVTKDENGHSLLSVTLPRKNVKLLEDFTSNHLGEKIAIVCDGEIITLHKVPPVIHDGKVQIARCEDNACEILLTKLSAESK